MATQLDTEGNKVEPCTRPGTYDYFSGSEISFIATFIVLGISIICKCHVYFGALSVRCNG